MADDAPACGLVLFVGALFLADRLGRSFVQPIQPLAGFTRRLGDDQRPEPVVVHGPSEIRELGQAFNRLVGRVEVVLTCERESVSDLSHRLRTPVTAWAGADGRRRRPRLLGRRGGAGEQRRRLQRLGLSIAEKTAAAAGGRLPVSPGESGVAVVVAELGAPL